MKASWILFAGLSLFYAIMTIVYWQVGGEPAGIACLLLSSPFINGPDGRI